MDVTRVVPRAGFVVAATMVLALVATSAAAAADSTLSRNAAADPITIDYQDPTGNTDRFRVEPGDTPGWRFVVTAGGAAIDAGDGCTDVTLFCPDDPSKAELFKFNLGPLDDVADLSPLTGPDRRPSDVQGGSGNDKLHGGGLADDFSGGSGDDTLIGLAGADRFRGHDGFDTLDLSAGGPWTVTLNGAPDDGQGATGTANVDIDVEQVIGGPLADDLTGAVKAETLRGNAGDDLLEGGTGVDKLIGDAGEDTFVAEDRFVDDISCGADFDEVFADWNDVIAADCELVTRARRDDDGDGFPVGVDCDDTNANVKPGGGVDVPGNGLDEDCNGGDAVVDADADGAAAGVDCDDADRARFPGATDVPANGVDENCDGRDAAFPKVAATIGSSWKVFARYTRVTSLTVRGAPSRATVVVRCSGGERKGCPFKRRTTRASAKGFVSLTKRFAGARLRPSAVIEVRVSAPSAIAKVLRITVRSRKAPKRRTLCLPPGAAKPVGCG